MMITRLTLLILLAAVPWTLQGVPLAQGNAVAIQVDAADVLGPMTPIWSWFGYDEPNYTYGRDGQKLLTELSELSPAPVYVRAHNLLTSGDGTPGLKWGSANAYAEGPDGRPIYDWTILVRIIDTYIGGKMQPLVEIGYKGYVGQEFIPTGDPLDGLRQAVEVCDV